MVLFLIAKEMRYGEHVRHFKARAQRLADEGDEVGELHCLALARALCDDSDHELLYDQAVGMHERGELLDALELYERAHALSHGRDARVANNLAAVRNELEQGEGTRDAAWVAAQAT